MTYCQDVNILLSEGLAAWSPEIEGFKAGPNTTEEAKVSVDQARGDNGLPGFAAEVKAQLIGQSSIPLYHQLFRILQRYVERAELHPGDRFPAEETISRHFGVSRPTASRAVQELVSHGWLQRERGRGTFVQAQPIVDLTLLSEHLSLTEQFPPDAALETRLICRQVLTQHAQAANVLRLPETTEILYLRRLRLVGGRPVMVCDAYLPADRFRDLDRRTFVRGSLYATLEEKYGFTVERSERRVEAEEVVDQDVADLLGVPLLTPILLLTGLTFVRGEPDPIEFMVSHVRERVAFKSTVRRRETRA